MDSPSKILSSVEYKKIYILKYVGKKYYGSQWGPATIWLPVFFKISYFMFHSGKKLFVLFSFYVWITWVITNIWWKFHVNRTFRNIFTVKNGDVFNTYFTRYMYIYTKDNI